MAKLTITLELEMDFIPDEMIQKNILWNVARILKDGGTNSGLVSSKLYPEDDGETDRTIPFIDKLTATGALAEGETGPVTTGFIGAKEERDMTFAF